MLLKVLLGIVGLVILVNALGSSAPSVPSSTAASYSTLPAVSTSAPVPSGPALYIEKGWGCTHSSSYMTLQGQVTNVTNAPIRRVTAVATYSTADGTFVTSDTALVEYDPLLPGQTSPFKVLTRYNPALEKCNIAFKELIGGSIPFEYR